MSLILDALNRADQERTEENHIPNLHASHGPAPETSRPVRRWIIEAAIVCLAVSAFVYSQWSDDSGANIQTESIAVSPIATAAEKAPPIPQKTVAETSAKSTAENKTVIEKPVRKPATPEANATITSLYKQPTAKNKISAPTISEAPVIKEEPAIDNTRFILQQIPFITERSSRFQRSIPNIDYEVHVYSEEDGAGFVKLNGNIVRVGAQLMPGLRLIAILNDSIVLDLNGTQFRLPALNSWANYN